MCVRVDVFLDWRGCKKGYVVKIIGIRESKDKLKIKIVIKYNRFCLF